MYKITKNLILIVTFFISTIIAPIQASQKKQFIHVIPKYAYITGKSIANLAFTQPMLTSVCCLYGIFGIESIKRNPTLSLFLGILGTTNLANELSKNYNKINTTLAADRNESAEQEAKVKKFSPISFLIGLYCLYSLAQSYKTLPSSLAQPFLDVSVTTEYSAALLFIPYEKFDARGSIFTIIMGAFAAYTCGTVLGD